MKICTSCQVENDADAGFCKGCGAALADQAPRLPAPHQPPPPGQPLLDDWYYYKRGGLPERYVGPLSWMQLLSHAKTETLRPEDFVWNPAFPDWRSAARYPELFARSTSGISTPKDPNSGLKTAILVCVLIILLVIVAVIIINCAGCLVLLGG